MACRCALMVLMVILVCLTSSAEADRPKPKLLDGELIEEGETSPEPPPAFPPETRPETQTSQTVTLLKEFSVSLPANPSTGFGWKVISYDREFLQLLRTRYQKPAQPLPGAPGQEFFDFLPRQTGTTTIILHYQRPFDKQYTRELRHTVIIK